MILSIRVVKCTPQYDLVRSWYEDKLNMRPLSDWDRGPGDRGVLLVFDGRTSTTSVELLETTSGGTQDPGTAAHPSRRPADVSLSFEVDNVGAWYETLTGRGVVPESEPENKPWGHRSFVTKDPDGLRLSFYQDMNQDPAN